MTPNGFKPADLPVHPKEIGKLVKEIMIRLGNTVTIHDVRRELSDAGVTGYSQVSFDKWYERLFVKKEPEPEPEESKHAPSSDEFPADKKMRDFLRFATLVEQIGGVPVAERYINALREITNPLPLPTPIS